MMFVINPFFAVTISIQFQYFFVVDKTQRIFAFHFIEKIEFSLQVQYCFPG
jgi:hypothetical protein